ncbi:MAG: hypothetical protein K8I30_09905, partial [Anaerolineae bacterium]|nr:hypothetical protein [Anaerolineae bacterium]
AVPTSTATVAASATAAQLEAPTLVTVPPSGQNSAATPQTMADVVITEAQFQEALDVQLTGYTAIQSARVDFSPDGLHFELTALGGEAFITGQVTLSVEMNGSFLAITPVDIAVNAPEPPAAYVETVNGDLLGLILSTLDVLLNERLGSDHDLENLTLTDTQMQISLLVAQS